MKPGNQLLHGANTFRNLSDGIHKIPSFAVGFFYRRHLIMILIVERRKHEEIIYFRIGHRRSSG